MSTHKNSVNKVNVTIRINKKIYQQAKDSGLNVSKITEIALLRSIKALNNEFLGEASLPKEGSVEPRAGFEPATSALPRQCPTN